MRYNFFFPIAGVLIVLAVLVACTGPQLPASQTGGEAKLRVVATTSIVSDVVGQVGGEKIELTTLLPLGADPHGYEPVPRDIARVAEADVVFANGAGLEEFLEPMIESAGAGGKVGYVSDGVALMQCEEGYEGEAEGHEHEGADPHTWVDPNNVMIWVETIEAKLSELDPENAGYYQANSEKYVEELRELDAWIRGQVEQIPEANRKIVTDHTHFCYFIEEYGFEQVGAIFPGYSTSSEPSAGELAALEDAIKTFDVEAVFVGNTVNPELAQRVAEDTGTIIMFIYTGSLSEPEGEAGTYLDYMRYNVRAIVDGLK